MNHKIARFLLRRCEKSLRRLSESDAVKNKGPTKDYVDEALVAVSAALVHFETETPDDD